MTTIASRAPPGIAGQPAAAARPRLGLSGRLILLTMAFVMLAEILIYMPSAVSFLRSWTSDRVMGAQMMALALSSASPDEQQGHLASTLVAGVRGAQAIGIRGQGGRWLLADPGTEPPAASRTVDLRSSSWWRALRAVFRVQLWPSSSPVLIVAPGVPGFRGLESVELLITDAPLRAALLDFTRRFVVVSFLVSAITAALLYLALHMMVVRPVRRLATNVAEFAADPEDSSRVIRPSGRTDEIGRAEEALARMETALASELRQKRRLADLGLAVSKINHELRNMLTTAQLLGDRLGEVEDPTVRRIAPRLVRTLNRAIAFCGATLAYGRASEPAPQRRRIPLRPLVEEHIDLAALTDGVPVAMSNEVPDGLEIDADPDQLARVLLNLVRNAVEALSQARTADARVEIAAERRDGTVLVRVSDNGPGVPERVRGRLFSAFQASERSGGTGLGLPVADELLRLHGGSIVLETSTLGASFLLTVPDRDGRPASTSRSSS